MLRPRLIGACAAFAVSLAAPAIASAATLANSTLRATGSSARICHSGRLASVAGVRTIRATATETGLLRATLAGRGDWDLAVFGAGSGRLVAAGAAAGDRELVQGFVAKGEALVIQGCRRNGASPGAQLHVTTVALPPRSPGGREQLVSVATPDRAARNRLSALGLDFAENATKNSVDIVLHGAQDVATLAGAGLAWTVKIADLRALAATNLVSDRRRELRAAAPLGLPSARESYRHLADYEAEMKTLAARHPGLVKLITLPHRSLLGREILGVEIARDVNVDNGQPVFLQLGLHHAREWPAAEHPMEWAHELVKGYGNDPHITKLVDATRTIVVPVVNPDGFDLSREWPIDVATAVAGVVPAPVSGMLPIENPPYLASLLVDQGVAPLPGTGFTYKRRNCRVQDGRDPAPGECQDLNNRRTGVDPNRNYGGFWGGPGASFQADDDTYRGAAPFSEPEVQNVRELVSAHQVTTLITNHTFGNLILRPPGLAAIGDPPDEPLYRELADAMASKNGYTSQHGFDLYDTTGTTEDWSYYATGGLGFTFEIGATEFHPPFAQVASLYAGNREAYLVAQESTASEARHALVEGRAAPGTVLRVHKQFESYTSPVLLNSAGLTGPPRAYRDVLDSTITVGDSGRFSWHLNPSTRPTAPAPESWEVTCERPTGTVTARGSITIGRGERQTLDLCALSFSLAVDRRPLARALQRGLRARAHCSLSCAPSVRLSVDNATARRNGLAKAVSARRTTVARGGVSKAFKGRRLFNVRFTAPARKALLGARALRLRLTAVGREGKTVSRTIKRTMTLRR